MHIFTFRGTDHNAFINRTIELIIIIFCSFLLTYRKSSALFKKPARSTPVSFYRRDRRTPVRLPRSNEARGRVTKGHAAQTAYAGSANEVVPIWAIKNSLGACNDSHLTNLIKTIHFCPCFTTDYTLSIVGIIKYNNILLICSYIFFSGEMYFIVLLPSQSLISGFRYFDFSNFRQRIFQILFISQTGFT